MINQLAFITGPPTSGIALQPQKFLLPNKINIKLSVEAKKAIGCTKKGTVQNTKFLLWYFDVQDKKAV